MKVKKEKKFYYPLDVVVGLCMDVWGTWIMIDDVWFLVLIKTHLLIMDEVWKLMDGYATWQWISNMDEGFMKKFGKREN